MFRVSGSGFGIRFGVMDRVGVRFKAGLGMAAAGDPKSILSYAETLYF